MYPRRDFLHYCLGAVFVTLGGCTSEIFESDGTTTTSEVTTGTTTTTLTTTPEDTSSTETTTCDTPTTVDSGGTDLSVANWRSTAEQLSVDVYRLTDDERERVFSETYSLSAEQRARSDDVIPDSGRYRIEASTENGASTSFETALPDENDEPLDHYSIDVDVTESGNIEVGLTIVDVGTPTAFADDC